MVRFLGGWVKAVAFTLAVFDDVKDCNWNGGAKLTARENG